MVRGMDDGIREVLRDNYIKACNIYQFSCFVGVAVVAALFWPVLKIHKDYNIEEFWFPFFDVETTNVKIAVWVLIFLYVGFSLIAFFSADKILEIWRKLEPEDQWALKTLPSLGAAHRVCKVIVVIAMMLAWFYLLFTSGIPVILSIFYSIALSFFYCWSVLKL